MPRILLSDTSEEFHAAEYIEGFYNPKRPHSANNMLTPNQKERNYFESL
ncbi:hypothetical protein [Listeria ivanovii]|nr:hypothetical protein [Listeria ivanovii]